MSIKLSVSHGADKYNIAFDDPEHVTVEDLKGILHEKTGVLPESQKLIFSGKTLSKNDQFLGEVGIKDNSRLMLLGRKVDGEQDKELSKKINEIDSDINSIENKIKRIQDELKEIEKGFLPEDLAKQSREKLQKTCLACNENLMKLLESLDAVIPGGQDTLLRGKRKALVAKVQSLMNLTDDVHAKLHTFS